MIHKTDKTNSRYTTSALFALGLLVSLSLSEVQMLALLPLGYLVLRHRIVVLPILLALITDITMSSMSGTVFNLYGYLYTAITVLIVLILRLLSRTLK